MVSSDKSRKHVNHFSITSLVTLEDILCKAQHIVDVDLFLPKKCWHVRIQELYVSVCICKM